VKEFKYLLNEILSSMIGVSDDSCNSNIYVTFNCIKLDKSTWGKSRIWPRSKCHGILDKNFKGYFKKIKKTTWKEGIVFNIGFI